MMTRELLCPVHLLTHHSSFIISSFTIMNNIPPSIQLGRPNHRRKRRSVVSTPLPPTALMVVSATAEVTGGGIEAAAFVTFDCTEANPLADVSGASNAKWSLRLDGQRWTAVIIETMDFQQIYIGFGPHVAEAGADELSYTNAPSDIADTLGRQLAAFVWEL
jgi:hypothetical protein